MKNLDPLNFQNLAKYRRGDQIIQTFYRIGSPQKLGPPSLICRNVKSLTKKSSESYRTHGNLMNDKEFGSLKVLKLKYRRGDQINQLFFRSAWIPKKSSPLDSNNSVILQNWFPTSSLEIGPPCESETISEIWRKVFESSKIYYL